MDVQKYLIKRSLHYVGHQKDNRSIMCSTTLKSVSRFENEYDGVSVWFCTHTNKQTYTSVQCGLTEVF